MMGDVMRFVLRSRGGGRQASAGGAVQPISHQEVLITQLRRDDATGDQRLGTGQRRYLYLAVPHPRHGPSSYVLICRPLPQNYVLS